MSLYRYEFRRDTADNWADANPVLAEGEPGFEVDTGLLKVGDGTSPYVQLPYIGSGAASGADIISGTVSYDRLPVGTTSRTIAAGNDGRFYNARTPSGPAGGALVGTFPNPNLAPGYGLVTQSFSYAGTLARGDFQFRWYNDTTRVLTIDAVRASLGAAPTGSSAIFDVQNAGVSVFTDDANRPTVTAGQFSDITRTVAIPTVAPNDYLTVSVLQVGGTYAGANLTLTVIMS